MSMTLAEKKAGLNKLLITVGVFVIAIIILIFIILKQGNSIEKGLFTAQFVFPVIAILAIIASVLTLAIVSVVFAVYQDTPSPHALGMPAGSVRALIALSMITSFVISAVFFFTTLNESTPVRKTGITQTQINGLDISSYTIVNTTIQPDSSRIYTIDFIPPVNKESSEFARQLLTVFGTLVIAVSSFYYGSRATEQGGVVMSSVLKDTLGYSENSKFENVPQHIIEEAIKKNRTDWLMLYKVIDIKVGKKKIGDTTNNVNCIVFIVENKEKTAPDAKSIPAFIAYHSLDGSSYSIPTDVIEDKSTSEASANPEYNSDKFHVYGRIAFAPDVNPKPTNFIQNTNLKVSSSSGAIIQENINPDASGKFTLLVPSEGVYSINANLRVGQEGYVYEESKELKKGMNELTIILSNIP